MTEKKQTEKRDSLFASDEEEDFYKAISYAKRPVDAYTFFHDLCTPSELAAMQERWTIVRILDTEPNISYAEIRKRTGASLGTIGRVARYLKKEYYRGYETILKRMKITRDFWKSCQ